MAQLQQQQAGAVLLSLDQEHGAGMSCCVRPAEDACLQPLVSESACFYTVIGWLQSHRCVADCCSHPTGFGYAYVLLCVNDPTTVVDTSANYMGGNSEILVGEGVDRWRSSGDGEEKSLTVISKFGYASVSVLQPQLHHDMPLALRENGSQHPPHIEHRPEHIDYFGLCLSLLSASGARVTSHTPYLRGPKYSSVVGIPVPFPSIDLEKPRN